MAHFNCKLVSFHSPVPASHSTLTHSCHWFYPKLRGQGYFQKTIHATWTLNQNRWNICSPFKILYPKHYHRVAVLFQYNKSHWGGAQWKHSQIFSWWQQEKAFLSFCKLLLTKPKFFYCDDLTRDSNLYHSTLYPSIWNSLMERNGFDCFPARGNLVPSGVGKLAEPRHFTN